MNQASAAPATIHDPLFAVGQSVGLAAFVWGYPLVESFRTCRMMVGGADEETTPEQLPMEHLRQKPVVNTSDDRLVVASAIDLLYGTAWLNLANGPRLIHVPSSKKHGNRYFVLALYDAWTNNFENPGRRGSDARGETIALVGPGTPKDFALPAGVRVVLSPTDLVWLIPRVMIDDGEDLAAAHALQADIRVECPPGTHEGRKPSAVLNWVGNLENTVDDLIARPEAAAEIAANFFTNLCHCLADTSPPTEEQGLLAWFKNAELVPTQDFDWQALPAPLREGLQRGAADAVALLVSARLTQTRQAWQIRLDIGRYGRDYLSRAVVAWVGLAANASEETLYANCLFDADGQPLDGRNRYDLRFSPEGVPPVNAFWSITLYKQDRFFYPNPYRRYAIGDRTRNLRRDPDGGITLAFGGPPEPDNPNWLPAPAGRFYLSLRMYDPRPEAKTWQGPQVKRVAS